MVERASLRVNPRTPVRVQIGSPGGTIVQGVVANVSEQGACVVTEGEFPVGGGFVLHLRVSPEKKPLRAAARVVWAKPAGDFRGTQRYGLRWVHGEGQDPIGVQEFILALLASPDHVQGARAARSPVV